MSGTRHTKVFLSHASEDKARFVLPFAQQLRSLGVDVWVDRWEMLPGDSLVEKIFVEGLDNASAVIVVISNNSLSKPWVAEELDSAVVKRIEDGSKLIPVVLDDLRPDKIPAPIRHLLFEPVPDTSKLDEVVDRVLRAIHGDADRPPLGVPPPYASAPAAKIGGLDRIDSLVLRAAGAEAVRDCGTRFATAEFLASVTAELSIAEEAAIESLEVLDNVGMIAIQRTFGSGIESMSIFALTPSGLETFLRAYEPEYPTIEETTLARLAGWPEDQGTELELTEAVGGPRLIVQHVLDLCAARGLLKIMRTAGRSGVQFWGISPRLRRLSSPDHSRGWRVEAVSGFGCGSVRLG